MRKPVGLISAVLLMLLFIGCSEPLSTREKGAAIGTFGGAGLGAIIGSATGNAGAGAAKEAYCGTVIGDQMQKRQNQDAAVQQQIQAQQAEIDRQQRELNQLKAQQQER